MPAPGLFLSPIPDRMGDTMIAGKTLWIAALLGTAICSAPLIAADAAQATESAKSLAPIKSGVFRGTHQAVRFDVSIPLREMTPKPIVASDRRGGALIDPDGDLPKLPSPLVDQPDGAAQLSLPAPNIPAPGVSFDGPTNLAGVAPPDPAGVACWTRPRNPTGSQKSHICWARKSTWRPRMLS